MHDVGWAEPVLPPVVDLQFTAELKQRFGRDMPGSPYIARSVWLRNAVMANASLHPRHTTERLQWLATLVTSQENSCRYCYGAARAYLKMLGVDDAQLDHVERDMKMAGADDKERALLHFCRNLSRSNPRPARSELDALVASGYSALTVVEIAFAVAATCFNNRVATFLALPLDSGQDVVPGANDRLLKRVLFSFKKLAGHVRPRPAEVPPRSPRLDGPYSGIVALINGTDGAGTLDDAVRGAFATRVLPVRTKAWVFAIVARGLDCKVCDQESARLLTAEGVTATAQERILASLSGPELDATERVLLPWVRETIHYQTEVMQRKTRELRGRLDDGVVLEAIGLAALANTCARLGLLAQ
jgi:alkylhydroperoxidase family enzyme